jgi:membrane protease YdiL (CAAX protease family)
VDATARRGTQNETVVVVWAAITALITLLSILPIFLYNVDLSTLSFGSDIPVVVGVGILLTGYAPAFAAMLAVRFVPGAGGIRRLLAPAVRWRVHPIWYAIAILGPIGLFLVGDVIRSLLGLEVPSAWLALPSASALAFLAGALIAGSFGEEVGWRGLAQPRLQQRRGALAAAIIVGVLWSLWHLWPVLAPGGFAMTGVSGVVLTFVRLVATSVVYAWLLKSTRGSLLIVMLAHAGHNVAAQVVPLPGGTQQADPVTALLYVAAAVIAVLFLGIRAGPTVRTAFPDSATPSGPSSS